MLALLRAYQGSDTVVFHTTPPSTQEIVMIYTTTDWIVPNNRFDRRMPRNVSPVMMALSGARGFMLLS